MIYISEIIGKDVWDAYGNRIGTCTDVLAGMSTKMFPPIVALQVKHSDGLLFLITAGQIGTLYPGIALNVPQTQIDGYKEKGEEFQKAVLFLPT